MKIPINLREDITQLEQMAQHLGLQPINNTIEFPKQFGTGFCRLYELPFQIQLHHYQYCLHQQIEVQSFNNLEDGMYIVNINLSTQLLNKQISDTPHWLSRAGENGVMYYSPGNNSKGKNEIDVPFEVLFFSIPKFVLQKFLKSIELSELEMKLPFCHYAELDEALSNELLSVLNPTESINLFERQGRLLSLLGKILSIFHQQKWYGQTVGLKMDDVEKLLTVKGILKRHIFGNSPTIAELAQQINMSPSQLKSKFKALFGSSIYQYYLKAKLNIAKNLIANQEGTIAEIGYRLGYSNISQFSSQFKKQFGFPPSELKS
ncbi:MAG: AraC family transcriptional regulator [Bacteroidota bacterium]